MARARLAHLRAAGAAGEVSVVVTKQQMVAFSNGIVLGDADVAGPLLDVRDGAGQPSGLVRVVPLAPVALLAHPAGGAAVGNLARLSGRAASVELRAVVAYDRPEQATARVAAACELVGDSSDVASLDGCRVVAGGTQGQSGRVVVEMSAGALVAAVSVRVWAPAAVSVAASDTALGAVGAARGGATRYQSARLRALADGYDATALDGVRFVSSDASVVEVRGATAVGVAPGVAFVSLAASPSVGVTITVSDAAAAPVRLVGRASRRLAWWWRGRRRTPRRSPSPRSTRRLAWRWHRRSRWPPRAPPAW